jgi:putative membrane protein
MLINQMWVAVARAVALGAALVLSAGVATSLTACTSKADADDPPPPIETASLDILPLSQAGQEFLTSTFEMGLLEISAAKLAMEKSNNILVKQFAELMVESYSRANDSVRQIALAHELALPTGPNPGGQELLRRLQDLESADFDRIYSHEMRTAHEKAKLRFNAAADSAPDVVVQEFARAQLPAMRDRFRLAQTLPSAQIG